MTRRTQGLGPYSKPAALIEALAIGKTKNGAARHLGIHYTAVNTACRKHGITLQHTPDGIPVIVQGMKK
jgi:hypothetical protein